MIGPAVVVAASLGYLLLLFAIAYYGDRRAEAGRSLIASPYIYALSIAVYCTAWTFYGSVGRAATTGVGFLPIYLGPTLMFALGWVVLRKMIRIAKVHRITSIADFIASRYGKGQLIGGLVTVIAVIGIMPYISLQLKAVASSFHVLTSYPVAAELGMRTDLPIFSDTAFWVAAAMALFSILFGTRHIDATEHHQGMVAAIAFESIVKLLAFLAVGIFVTFGMFDGFGDLFSRAGQLPRAAELMTVDSIGPGWVPLTILAMLAVICLPRQFQVTVVENVDERHLGTAIWLFPLYLLLINVFVLPIALAGLIVFAGAGVDADTFVLALPLSQGADLLALLAFIGGLSAATGMVIVATVALSTMICNDLIMPALLRFAWLHISERTDLSGLLLGIRRGAIIFIMLIGYFYFQLIGESYALVTIGLVSFAAAAQFAPAILIGMYWKGATRQGALTGIIAGFAVWLYTLLLPAFALSGWLPASFVTEGPFGIEALKPYALFGMTDYGPIAHALFWSLLANVGALVGASLFIRPSTIERTQATLFVEVFHAAGHEAFAGIPQASVRIADLRALSERFLGAEGTARLFDDYARRRGVEIGSQLFADSDLIQFVERRLSGVIGAASSRIMVASTAKGEGIGTGEIMQILDETSQVLEYSRQLEGKSQELEQATKRLQAANERLRELDRLKDDFLSTVTHELRTPLTSIRSFSEILHDSPELELAERQHFLTIIIRESERLTRLINQVLDLTKMETGRMKWQIADVDICQVVDGAVESLRHLFEEKQASIEVRHPDKALVVRGDQDQLTQLIINLLSNAQKFCPEGRGRVRVVIERNAHEARVHVADNGPGIPHAEQEAIFDKFHQVKAKDAGNPHGSGLGLAICRNIVQHLGGTIWVESTPGYGASFIFTIPASRFSD